MASSKSRSIGLPKPPIIEEILADLAGCADDDVVFQADKSQGSSPPDHQLENLSVQEITPAEVYTYVRKLFTQYEELKQNIGQAESNSEKVQELKRTLESSLGKLESDSCTLESEQ